MKTFCSRVAKLTPKKIGFFVTLWKREKPGDPIQPYDAADPIDFFVIKIKTDTHAGEFVFPKEVLVTQGVLSQNGKGGIRGMRVYAPWNQPESRQALKTQAWQCLYFEDFSSLIVSEKEGLAL